MPRKRPSQLTTASFPGPAFASAETSIRRIQALCGNLPIYSYSWLDRPEVAKWFRILGFNERERGNGFIVYELDSA